MSESKLIICATLLLFFINNMLFGLEDRTQAA